MAYLALKASKSVGPTTVLLNVSIPSTNVAWDKGGYLVIQLYPIKAGRMEYNSNTTPFWLKVFFVKVKMILKGSVIHDKLS